ncbi:MAG: GNAT family N-acetyltransferase [Pirellulales bacterium]|jgi:CelD/BcsL family acetyltransferase involved in cellulose biosynthesis
MHCIIEINNIEELAPYRADWNRLLRQTDGATFFQSLEWLEVFWCHYQADRKLRILFVIEGDELTGIVPLIVQKEQSKLGSVRYLTYPLNYWGSFYGPISANPQLALTLALKHVKQTERDWDSLELRWANSEQATKEETTAALDENNLSYCESNLDSTSLISLSGTWEDYWQSRPGKWRNNFKRWNRNLEKLGTVRYERYRPQGQQYNDGDPRWDLFDTVIEIAQKSWQGDSETGTTLSHSSILPFIKDVHLAAAKAGSLDLNLLYINDQPAAFVYNYYYEQQLFGLRVGFDPEISRNGLGNILYAKVIEGSFTRGDTRYDLGPGSIEQKKYFRTELVPILRYSHYPKASIIPNLLRMKRNYDQQWKKWFDGGGQETLSK